MVKVSVKREEGGSYRVTIGSHEITLPKGSKATETKNDKTKIGKGTTRVEVDGHDYTMTFVRGKKKQVVLEGGDDDAEEAALQLNEEWAEAYSSSGGSRLNREARRTKRNSRNLKRSKLRKLTTRRR